MRFCCEWHVERIGGGCGQRRHHDLAAQGNANASGARNDGRIMSVSGNNQARIGVGDVRSSGGAGAVQGATGVHGAGVAGARQVAAGGLFIHNPDASGDYLFEARPQFANQGQWTSSDYLLNQIGMDPNATHQGFGVRSDIGTRPQLFVFECQTRPRGSVASGGLANWRRLWPAALASVHATIGGPRGTFGVGIKASAPVSGRSRSFDGVR